MNYCAAADLPLTTDELAELTTDSGGAYDAAAVALAIGQASGQADSYLGGRYIVPVSPAPDVLQKAVANMAAWLLCADRNMPQEARRQAYEDAVGWLKDVAAGRANLPGVTTAEAASAPADDQVDLASAPREYTFDTLKGF